MSDVIFWCAALPAGLFCWNLIYFRRPPVMTAERQLLPVSVLIPARNEEGNIGAVVESVLRSRGVELEVVVLDDHSTDQTADIVEGLARQDDRVRCVASPKLEPGWAGKAHAAHVLSTLAKHDVFCFIDADVRLEPDALARMLGLLRDREADMVSGFPDEITVTFMEWLLLPLIHFLLLCYLPFAGLRYTRLAAFGAGCGQFLMLKREGYERSGGYASIRTTMHDGIMMAKLFRTHGLRTDVADLTGLARCRMYLSGSDVWQGLMKNATEGIAAPARIVPFTLLLVCGSVGPWVWLAVALARRESREVVLAMVACGISLLPRLISVWRFRQRVAGALLHPLAVLVFLALQWTALVRKLRGTPAVWKGRAFEVG